MRSDTNSPSSPYPYFAPRKSDDCGQPDEVHIRQRFVVESVRLPTECQPNRWERRLLRASILTAFREICDSYSVESGIDVDFDTKNKLYECRCECGNEFRLSEWELDQESVTSCGCIPIGRAPVCVEQSRPASKKN